jgi:hypothetical protein
VQLSFTRYGRVHQSSICPITKISCPPLLEGNSVVGFFYGASQNGGEKCGAGALLKCPVGVFIVLN